MIITREMYDEFVESAENQNVLWTDTLALIGVTVGDVPDVDVIDAQAAEIEKLRDALMDCWLKHDEPATVDMIASAALAQEAQS
jgi:hypothetical protein